MSTENLRSMLVIALCMVVFLLWQAWVEDYGQTARPATEEPSAPIDGQGADSESDIAPTLPVAPVTPATTRDSGQTPVEPEEGADSVRVRTDVYSLVMDANSIYRLDLLAYPVEVDAPDDPFPLLTDSLPNIFVIESGLLGSNNEPRGETKLMPRESEYVLAEGQDELEVVFDWSGPSGIQVEKIYRFGRGSYRVEVDYRIHNGTDQPWSGRMYGQFSRTQVASSGGLFQVYTYTGGILSSEEKPYEKVDFEDMAEQAIARAYVGGWVAMIQHYFAGAWIPGARTENHYYSKANSDIKYTLGVYYDQQIPPAATGEMEMVAYIGPKVQKQMEAVAPGLRRTVDFGWLFFIAEPLFWLLSRLHEVLGNWGWSIILLTVLIKLAFFHLSATSYKSMARMRKLQPRMTQLRERYGSDRARMNQALMELYKTEKINPLGGCLPIVVQIPVFIALYWVLLESVELRQATFMFWLDDLSQRDPFYVLPILMGISMFVQQRLNPAPPDPIQAKIMMALPFVFTIFFLGFPSGLVLYWIVNNLLSIAQQWVITKRIEAA